MQDEEYVRYLQYRDLLHLMARTRSENIDGPHHQAAVDAAYEILYGKR